MKYIILAGERAIVFPDSCVHKEVAGVQEVIAAGFCSIETYRSKSDPDVIKFDVNTWGRSDSLDIGSRLKDKLVIEQSLSGKY